MSIARRLVNDMRPLFRLLEEPFGRHAAYYGSPIRSVFDDPFFQSGSLSSLRPNIDVTEEGNNYVVEADLPGVKKENVEVRIGDGGHSVTIQGKIHRRGNATEDLAEEKSAGASSATPAEGSDAKSDQHTSVISAERPTSVVTSSSTFTRTVWLPRPVDGESVSAKLLDGVLTLTIPKADDKGSVKVDIE